MSSTMEDSAKDSPVVGKLCHTFKVGHHQPSQSFYAPSFSDDSVCLWDGARQPVSALCRSNEVFRDSLECGMDEEILAEGVHPQWALDKLSDFLEGGDVVVNDSNLVVLWEIALRFDVSSLAQLCQRYSEKTLELNATNCFDFLGQAVASGIDKLADKCQAYFGKNIEEVRGSRGFLYMTFAVVKALAIRGRHNAETAYCDVVRSLIVWLNDTEASKESIEELFGLLDVGLLSVKELESLRYMKEVEANAAIASCVVRNVDPKPAGSKKRARDDDDSGPALLVLEGGVWHEWSVPNSGWYLIAGEGGKGGDDNSSDNGGRGVTIGGSFWLGHGDRLKVLVGRKKSKSVRGGGGCCVAKIKAGMSDGALLLAAGGGGESYQDHHGDDAKLCDDMDNCKPLPTHIVKGRSHDGKGCGVYFGIKNSAREEFLSGPCEWCDGGSGGGGFYGGAGGSRKKGKGGKGGSSFIHRDAKDPFQMKNSGEPRVCVWKGYRSLQTKTETETDSQDSEESVFSLGGDLDEVTSK